MSALLRKLLGATGGGHQARLWQYQTTLSATTWGGSTSVNAFASNGTTLVAIGDNCRCATSTDGGATWTWQADLDVVWAATDDPKAIAWGAGVFCVVGLGGNVATSPDGVDWTNRTGLSGTTFGTNDALSIVWTGTQFVVAGESSRVGTSPDGITWTYRTGLITVWGTGIHATTIAWNGTTLVAGSGDGSSGGRIATSTDGITWTNQTSLSSGTWGNGVDKYVNCIVWNGLLFLAVGGTTAAQCATSPDGVTWTFRSGLATAWGSAGANGAIWEEGKFVVVGDSGEMATSVDGTTWVEDLGLSGTGYSTTESRCIGYANAGFIVGGTAGKICTYLTNGGDWAFDDVVFQMSMNGLNGSSSFTELLGQTISNVGSPALSTAQSVSGGSSFFNTSGNNYLTAANSAALALGTSDYTIEAHVRISTIVDFTSIIDNQGHNTSNLGWLLDINSAEKFRFTSWSPTYLTGTTTVVVNTWYHIAVTEQSGTMRMWVNGVLEDTDTTATNFSSATGNLEIGWGRNDIPLRGYIDNVRITRRCRYWKPFTPLTVLPEY